MTVEHLEVIVEEPSAEVAFRALLPKILGEISFEIYRHQGKSDLLSSLPCRLNGYSRFLPSRWRILVVVDRDDDDCVELKRRLETAARKSGLVTRSSRRGSNYAVVNRVAVEELEAWFLGDWQAVRAAYPRVAAEIANRRGFRDPDAVRGGTWEALERELQKAGYHREGFRKIEAARAISAHMCPDRNRSKSFQVFRDALREFAL